MPTSGAAFLALVAQYLHASPDQAAVLPRQSATASSVEEDDSRPSLESTGQTPDGPASSAVLPAPLALVLAAAAGVPSPELRLLYQGLPSVGIAPASDGAAALSGLADMGAAGITGAENAGAAPAAAAGLALAVQDAGAPAPPASPPAGKLLDGVLAAGPSVPGEAARVSAPVAAAGSASALSGAPRPAILPAAPSPAESSAPRTPAEAGGTPAPSTVLMAQAAVSSASPLEDGARKPEPSTRTGVVSMDARLGGSSATVLASHTQVLEVSPTTPDVGGDEQDRLRREPRKPGGEELAGIGSSPARPFPTAGEETTRTEALAAPRSIAEQVAGRIGLIRREGRHEILLQLEPPDLGAVRIEAVLEGRHLTLEIHAELARSRSILEQALPQLRESLSQQGIVPDRVTVHFGLEASTGESAGREFAAFRRPVFPESLPVSPRNSGAVSGWREPSPVGFDFWV